METNKKRYIFLKIRAHLVFEISFPHPEGTGNRLNNTSYTFELTNIAPLWDTLSLFFPSIYAKAQ